MKPMRLYFVNLFTSILPATRCYGLKRALYRWSGIELGNNVRIVSSAKIIGSGSVSIADNTFIGHDTLILVGGQHIVIGRDVDISSRVTLVNGTHHISQHNKKAAGDGYAEDIVIADGVWVGVSATIIAGANIGTGAIIAAGALVTGQVQDNQIVGGVPAKLIRNRHVND